jgi:hypothetical protein
VLTGERKTFALWIRLTPLLGSTDGHLLAMKIVAAWHETSLRREYTGHVWCLGCVVFTRFFLEEM